MGEICTLGGELTGRRELDGGRELAGQAQGERAGGELGQGEGAQPVTERKASSLAAST